MSIASKAVRTVPSTLYEQLWHMCSLTRLYTVGCFSLFLFSSRFSFYSVLRVKVSTAICNTISVVYCFPLVYYSGFDSYNEKQVHIHQTNCATCSMQI